jgi:hypothetical protein
VEFRCARDDLDMDVDLAEVRRLLAALIAAVEAGELVATQAELDALRGALSVVEYLISVHNKTV